MATNPGWTWAQVAPPIDNASSIEFYGSLVSSDSDSEAILFLLVKAADDTASLWAYTTSGADGYYCELLGLPTGLASAAITNPLGAAMVGSNPTVIVEAAGDQYSNVYACSLANSIWTWRQLSTADSEKNVSYSSMGAVTAGDNTYVLFTVSGDADTDIRAYTGNSTGWSYGELPANSLGGNDLTAMGAVAVGGVPSVIGMNSKNTLWSVSQPASNSNWKWSQLPSLPSTNTIEHPMGTVVSSGTPYLMARDKNQNLWVCSQATSSTGSASWRWAQLPAIPYVGAPANITGVGAAQVNSNPTLFVLSAAAQQRTILWSCQLDPTTSKWGWIQLPSLPDGSDFADSDTSNVAVATATDGTVGMIFLQSVASSDNPPAPATAAPDDPDATSNTASNSTASKNSKGSAAKSSAAQNTPTVQTTQTTFWCCYTPPN